MDYASIIPSLTAASLPQPFPFFFSRLFPCFPSSLFSSYYPEPTVPSSKSYTSALLLLRRCSAFHYFLAARVFSMNLSSFPFFLFFQRMCSVPYRPCPCSVGILCPSVVRVRSLVDALLRSRNGVERVPRRRLRLAPPIQRSRRKAGTGRSARPRNGVFVTLKPT